MMEAKPTWTDRLKSRGIKIKRNLKRDPVTPIFVGIVAMFFILFLVVPIFTILINSVYYDSVRVARIGDNESIYIISNDAMELQGTYSQVEADLYGLNNISNFVSLSLITSDFNPYNSSKFLYLVNELDEYDPAFMIKGGEEIHLTYALSDSGQEAFGVWNEIYKKFDFANVRLTLSDETYFNPKGDGTPLYISEEINKFEEMNVVEDDTIYYFNDTSDEYFEIGLFSEVSTEMYIRNSAGDFIYFVDHDFNFGDYADPEITIYYNNSGIYVPTFVFDGDTPRAIVGTAINTGNNHKAIWTSPYTDKFVYFKGASRGAIINSISIAVLTTIFSLIFGTAIAFIMARHEFPGKGVISIVLLLPLIIPPFVSGIGFYAIFGAEGILNKVLVEAFHRKIIIGGLVGIVYVQSSHFFTLIYLNVYSSLINVDPSLEEQAENLGSRGFHLFRTITLPLALPGLAAGSILVFILALEDLGTPLVFAAYGGDHFATNTVTYIIYQKFAQKEFASGVDAQSAVLGLMLIIFAFISFMMIRKFVTLRKYAMISKGRAGAGRQIDASKKRLMIFYPFFAIVILLSTVTHMGIILTSLTKNFSKFPPDLTGEYYKVVFGTVSDYNSEINNVIIVGAILTGIILIIGLIKEIRETQVGEFVCQFFRPKEGGEFSAVNYIKRVVTAITALTLIGIFLNIVFNGQTEYMPYIKNTVKYSLIATGLIIVLATIAAYSVARRNFPGKDWFDALITIPIAIPGVVLGLGYLILFGDGEMFKIGSWEIEWLTLNPFIYAPTILVISYTIRKFPFTVRSVFSGLQQTDEVLEEAAMNLGAGRIKTLFEITVPLIIMNVIAGALVSLVYCLTEVSTSLLLIDSTRYGTMTYKMAIESGDTIPVLCAMGVMLMCVQAITLVVTNKLLQGRAEAMTGI